ncbi:MAG: DUF2505 family protein [Acidimicrobiales bacterium]
MRFRFEHRFAADPDALARAYADPDLYPTLGGTSKLAPPELLDVVVDGDRTTLRVRYRFIGDLSPAARAVLDPVKLTWVVESVHDVANRSVAFTMAADHYPDRFRCDGTELITPDGTGACRTMTGELRVKAMLVGSTVERVLVQDLDDHLAAEVPRVEKFTNPG